MDGTEVRARRLALGLTQRQLADLVLGPQGNRWTSPRVSACEAGTSPVPDRLIEVLATLEQARDQATASTVARALEDPTRPVLTVRSDEDLAWLAPTMARVPAAVHQVATALAAAQVEASTGTRPPITTEDTMSESAPTMTPGEFATLRQLLGLTYEGLAALLVNADGQPVAPRTARAWESGRDPVPAQIARQITPLLTRHRTERDALVAAGHGLVRPRQADDGWSLGVAAAARTIDPHVRLDRTDTDRTP